MKLAAIKTFVARSLASHEYAKRTLYTERKYAIRASRRLNRAIEAQRIIQKVAQAIQQKAHKQIAKVVGRCLQTIFKDEGYDFRIEFVRKRGKTEAHLLFSQFGHNVSPKMVGGSVIDVAVIALHIACLLLAVPKRRKLLISDEPFRNLDADKAARVNDLIEAIAKDLKIQFVLMSRDPKLVAGKVIEL